MTRRPASSLPLVFAAALLALSACGKNSKTVPPPAKGNPAAEEKAKAPGKSPSVGTNAGKAGGAAPGERPVVVLQTTQGDIKIELLPDKAPEHVKNFLAHVRSGYFEGTYFHRVMPGFMIQGGDPNTKDDDRANDGEGGYSYKGPGTFLPAEFNDVKHVRGVVSMARGGDPNSAGSQFFIMVANASHLDGQYSAFGRVVEGMDVADRIVKQPGDQTPVGGVNPTERQYILKTKVVE